MNSPKQTKNHDGRELIEFCTIVKCVVQSYFRIGERKGGLIHLSNKSVNQILFISVSLYLIRGQYAVTLIAKLPLSGTLFHV